MESILDPFSGLSDEAVKTIKSMCLTVRHDYGLETRVKPENPDDDWASSLSSGMTAVEKRCLEMEMRSVYCHHIEPLIKEMAELRECHEQNLALSGKRGSTMAIMQERIEALEAQVGDLATPSGCKG